MSELFQKTFYRPIVFTEVARVAWPPSWLGHTPFAFWLMDELRPQTMVELGTHSGNSFSAFCQAAEIVKSKTPQYSPNCYAIDTWEGDPHAGKYGEDIYTELSAYISRTFGAHGIAHLVRSTFEQALSQFTDGSIDLLNIDGYHTYEATVENFTSWLPKMSKRSVVLIHDIAEHKEDFGVWKFWDEIKGKYPSFGFLHSHGLGVLLVGSEFTAGLQWMTSPQRTPAEIAEIQGFFTVLGAAPFEKSVNTGLHTRIWELETKTRDHSTLAQWRSFAQKHLGATVEEAEKNLLILNAQRNEGLVWKNMAKQLGSHPDEAAQNLAAQIAQLNESMRWKNLCQIHLGSSIEQAQQKLTLLNANAEAMQSPGHRVVSFLGRTVGQSFVGRGIRRILNLAVPARRA